MSRFIFAGNEIIPGTVVMTADGTITPKDDLRVILNISGGGTVSLSDGTDTTQRIEIVNVNADPCSFTYKGTGGSTTANIYTNTGIRLLWVGSYWETSMSTAVTGIDDNSQPFAFNIDSLVKPDGVINLTGTDANGNPFDYGLGKLVTVADEDNLVTGVEVKTSKTLNGKPVYTIHLEGDLTYSDSSSRRQFVFQYDMTNKIYVHSYGTMAFTGGELDGQTHVIGGAGAGSSYGLRYNSYEAISSGYYYARYQMGTSLNVTAAHYIITLYYTKTTD